MDHFFWRRPAASGIGRWFIDQGLNKASHIFAYDIDDKIYSVFIDNENVSPIHLDTSKMLRGDYLTTSMGNVNCSDWILLATPESALHTLTTLLSRHLPEGCHVGIMTSNQKDPISKASRALPSSVVFGLHPLFGPTVTSPHGQTIALCYSETNFSRFDELTKMFRNLGMTVSYLSPQEHDHYMSYIQTLTHFVLLSFSKLIGESNIELANLMKVKTPPFQFLSAFSSRLLMGTPSTYAAIQGSSESEKIRENFILAANNLHTCLSSTRQETREAAISAIRSPFSSSSIDEFSQFSLLAVAAVQEREKHYFDMMKNREFVVFITKGSNYHRVGRITNIDPSNLEIEELITRVKIDNGAERVPLPVNQNAVDAYAKKGINVKFNKAFKIKKSNITLLSSDAALTWLDNNMLILNHIIRTPNPMNLSEDIFETWIPRFIRSIVRCKYIDSYQKRKSLPKVRLSIELRPYVSLVKVQEMVRAFCYGYTPSQDQEHKQRGKRA